MPKQSNSRNENRKRSGHDGQDAGRGERGENGDEKRQEVRQDRQDRFAQVKDQKQQNQEVGSGKPGGMGAYRKLLRRNREERQAKGVIGTTKKNGCSPKLFMLALPIIAVGMYVFLVS
ncbi:MAG: hypothetical protein HY867_10465 [Chloroflexi bacterium]|nr:hypothetical protein [Chloroflexota bacterium]